MLSGDREEIVKDVASKLKINEYYGTLLPQDKVKKLNEIKKENFTAYIGDGINDAPVISLADVGISMGNLGSDAAIEASDIVLMNDDINKIITAIKIAKMTNIIVIANVVFALSIKFLFMILALIGFTTIWAAVFADVGVTLICIFNSLRILKKH